MTADSHHLEFWADSFHEGDWACRELGNHLSIIDVRYLKGFMPTYTYRLPNDDKLTIQVYGSYRSWEPLPAEVSDLLDWGKPDIVAYVPSKEEIIFAIEETAAVQTGNQALQRFDRIYGSARSGIPFWYLTAEYGLHVDGGVRRDSIWPSVCSLKLTTMMGCPCVVAHFSSEASPEDYTEGLGVESLFRTLSKYILWWLGYAEETAVELELANQYRHMLSFIDSQWRSVVDYLPGEQYLLQERNAEAFARRALGKPVNFESSAMLTWGQTQTLPVEIRSQLTAKELIKPDPFLPHIEALVARQRAYTLSRRAGSRPQPPDRVSQWIGQQERMFNTRGLANPPPFSLSLEDFPKSKSGLRHLTTARNVAYLCDAWSDVSKALQTAYPRLSSIGSRYAPEQPIFLYVSNSLTPGRIFGDPFTGQITAYSIAFAKTITGQDMRRVVAYYPHQVHTQLFEREEFKSNKGITLLRELVDVAVFHAGVAVDLKTGDLF